MSEKTEIAVLHLEDSEDDAAFIARELRKAYNIRLKVVSSGPDLHEALKEHWDIVLSDFAMPGFSGLEALDIIKKTSPGLPFVFVSGTIGEERAVTAIKSGATDFVIKTSLKRLIPVVDRVLKDAESGRRLRQSEDELQKSRKMYELLAENSTDIIAILNSDLIVEYVSPAIEAICGITPDQMVGTTGLNRIHPHDAGLFASVLRAAPNGGETFQISFRFIRDDGVELWLETTGKTIQKSAASRPDYITVTRDITGRVKAENRLREQAALLDIAHDAILVRDLNDQVIYWNKGAERIYGWRQDEVVGQSVQTLLYEDSTAYNTAIAQLLANGEFNGELAQKSRDGKMLTVDASWTLVRDETGQPKSVLCINSDITERKKLEQQFLRSQRMESIGTLAGGIAHDLNNMLTPILLAVEVLKMGELNPEHHELATTIGFSAQRGADMVRQVLTFARGAEGEFLPMHLGELIGDIDKLARDTFPKNIKLVTDVARDLWPINGNGTQLHQVLLNLAVNARDAMLSGGTLTIVAANRNIDEHYAKMSGEISPGTFVVVRVEDTGSGISADTLEKIFEPFFTTKEQGKGTGLGLSTTMAIIKSHKGSIKAYSEPGNGTRFHIFLPALTEDAQIAETPVEESLPHGCGELILVVDDEKMIREITRQTLESFGYRVKTAADGLEGVAVFAEFKGEIRLVLTDMMMPALDGAGMIQVIRKLNASVPVFATSGLTESGKSPEGRAAEVSRFLPKPYTARMLLKALHNELNPVAKNRG